MQSLAWLPQNIAERIVQSASAYAKASADKPAYAKASSRQARRKGRKQKAHSFSRE